MANVTKPMALDETLQATNTILQGIGLSNIGNMSALTTTDKTSLVGAVNELNGGKVSNSEVGVANGVAELDSTGKVPSSQLPAFVDDVIEGYFYNSEFYYDSAHTQLITPESGKIYVDLVSNKTYRWGGSAYVVISDTLALGETSTTAYRGDRGKTAYDHSQDASRITSAVAEGLYKVGGTAQGHISSMTAVQKADLTALGVADDADVEAIEDKIDETTTSISGNPISIPNLKANQLAVNPIITLEPIQAGSGTPSPSNIRAISGYDKIEVLSCGKNLFDKDAITTGYRLSNTTGLPESDASYCISNFVRVKANTAYYVTATSNGRHWFYDVAKNPVEMIGSSSAFTYTPTANGYIRISIYNYAEKLPTMQITQSSTAQSYEPYVKATSISESLGQTVYGGTLDVRTGKLTVDRQIVDLSELSWVVYQGSIRQSSDLETLRKGGRTNIISDRYEVVNIDSVANLGDNQMCGNRTTGVIYVKSTTPTGYAVYELATPFYIQLTPHEISLLKDYAYLSTNGTSIALDYHNGELASLGDVSQLAESVELIEERTNAEIGRNRFGKLNTIRISNGNSVTIPTEGGLYISIGRESQSKVAFVSLGNTVNVIKDSTSIVITANNNNTVTITNNVGANIIGFAIIMPTDATKFDYLA